MLTPEQVAALKGSAVGVESFGAAGTLQHSDAGVLHWDKAYRDAMAHPLIVPILEQLCGETFRLDHINVHTHDSMPERKKGAGLHGSNRPGRGLGLYHYNNGQFFNGLTTVTFELEDTHCNGGGFCCIPGARSPAPRSLSARAELISRVRACAQAATKQTSKSRRTCAT